MSKNNLYIKITTLPEYSKSLSFYLFAEKINNK